MAGIIGNMTAQARLRRGRKEVTSSKCVYSLEPFPSTGFRPELHNKYVRLRTRGARQSPALGDRDTEVQAAEECQSFYYRILIFCVADRCGGGST